MITVISGTNRQGSTTRIISQAYSEVLSGMDQPNRLFSLEDLPRDFAFTDLYGHRSDLFKKQLDEYILPAERFVVVMPEYNGTFPGILKLLFDAMHPEILRGKKIGMVGVANGRGGNLRGLDQFTAAMHYLQMVVYPRHLPLSLIKNHITPERQPDSLIMDGLQVHAKGMVGF
ncbi:MAG: NAD(P)H-dependent oxidoreductase [Bacteroidia bacterium]|jgi:NAD(P)H-dependent FMN reductase|nr:NAD(P)H-dependent oxidoreductase [Bacteroidia bacterium]